MIDNPRTSRAARLPGVVSPFWLVAGLLALALGASISQLGGSDAVWLTLLWAGWAVTVLWAFAQRPLALPLLVLALGSVIIIVIPATLHVASHHTTIAGEDYGAGTLRALQVCAVAQWALLAGAVALPALRRAPTFTKLSPRLDPAQLHRAVLLAAGAGFVGVGLDVVVGGNDLGQFLAFTSSNGYASFYTGSTSGYFLALQLVAGLAMMLLTVRVTSRRLARPSAAWVVLLIAVSMILLGVGQRGRFLVPLLACGLIWLKTGPRPVPSRRLTVLAFVAVFFLTVALGVFRQAPGQRELSLRSVGAQSFGGAEELFAPLAGLVQTVPSQVPYLHGRSYLETLVFPVPRALWHGKPRGSITEVTNVFDPAHNGLAFPEFGEMYANFGFAGVIIGTFALGMLIQWLWLMLAETTSIRRTLVVSVTLAIIAQIYVRGSLAPMFVTFLGLLLATAYAARRGSPIFPPEPAARPTG